MRKITPVLATLALLLTPRFSLAQQDEGKDVPFAAKPLQDGQPVLASGQQVQLDIANARHASIAAGDLLPSLFFMAYEDDNGRSINSLVIGRPEGGFTLKMVSLKRGEDGEARGIVDVRVNDTTTVPLELRFLPESNLLLYRWPDSPDSLSSAGGKPAPLRSSSMIKVGRSMPNFTVETLSGRKVSLESLRGKNVVINWWATSCAPCIAEMPGLNKLVAEYGDRNDIVFLAIAWNTKEELKRFFKAYDFAYRQAIYNERTVEIFGEAFPRNVIVDAKGKVAYDKLGGAEDQYEEIEAALHEHILDRN